MIFTRKSDIASFVFFFSFLQGCSKDILQYQYIYFFNFTSMWAIFPGIHWAFYLPASLCLAQNGFLQLHLHLLLDFFLRITFYYFWLDIFCFSTTLISFSLIVLITLFFFLCILWRAVVLYMRFIFCFLLPLSWYIFEFCYCILDFLPLFSNCS